MHHLTKGDENFSLTKKHFGDDFHFGVSSSALQTEGALNADGRGASNWDIFSAKKKSIRNNHTPHTAADFYNRYEEDISIIQSLNIPHFRFSLSWARLIPEGTGKMNQAGIDFYNRVINSCMEKGIEPWVTLYHWDLPQTLELKGGWTNRDITHWFEEYVGQCIRCFGDRVKHWMVLNEPMVFTGAGYFLGLHAPGKKRMKNFLPAVHHAVLCQSIGGRTIKREQPRAEVGTTFSCSYVTPQSNSTKDNDAAIRMDTLLNRLFVEPALGMGYPFHHLPFLKRIEKWMKPGDDELMKFNFDFIGIQNYTREVVRHKFYVPFVRSALIPANKRKVHHTMMNWEVYPESIYEMIKKFSSYPGIKKIIVTENGAAFPDEPVRKRVIDKDRIHFISEYLRQVYRAKNEGHKVSGYFVWSLTDNFEWAEGFHPRFGLVYINYENQQRIIKDSGYWYQAFLSQ